jgi:outer membrane immunogenic protein
LLFNSKRFFAALVIPLTGNSRAQASEFASPYTGVKVGESWSDASDIVNAKPRAMTRLVGFDVKQFMIGAEVLADFHHGPTTY